jgi:hypothetical protein
VSVFIWQIPDASINPPAATVPPGSLDHVAGALGRLLEQFKTKPNVVALVSALVGTMQPLEAALWDLFTKRQLATAFGAQLDALGVIVGQPRNGLSDSDYARYLNARVAANASDGRIEDLISVTRLVLNDVATTITIARPGVAAVEVIVTGDLIADALAAIVISFLRDARDAGIRLVLRTQPALDATTYFTSVTAFTTGSLSIGGTVVAVDSTAGFPSSGTMTLDVGGANVETVTYGAVDATHFLNCSPLTKTHASGARVDAATQLGLGLGDSTDGGQPDLVPYTNVGTTGGRMADARE